MERSAVAVTVRVEHLSTPGGFDRQPRVDGRTGTQWLKSAIAYCNFRAGDAWRDVTDPHQRWDEDRWCYIRAARMLTDALFTSDRPARPVPVLPPICAPSLPSLFQLELAHTHSRAELVDKLLAADPRLTDRRLLSHFTKAKLAFMVEHATRASMAAERRSA